MKVSYNWLQGYLKEKLPEPQSLVELISVRAFEVDNLEHKDDDFMIDIDVLPNRAHDCLSHRGIAKELSVILDIPFKDFLDPKDIETKKTDLKVEIEDSERCRRYIGRIIRNVKVGESPEWVKKYLNTIGQKSINSVVDATNLIMFDVGQPLHAFDLSKISGNTIFVKNAEDDEEITTLSDEEVKLKNWMLTIRDNVGPLAIAGVKGGKRAEVKESTTDIILESANFNPVTVRKTARRLGILTDSSKRFENEPTRILALEAMERLTQTILEIASTDNTVVEEIVDVYPQKEDEYKVEFSLKDISDLLGADIPENEAEGILNRFGFKYSVEDGNFVVNIPSERLDLRIKEDLIEEIGRIYGYENIPSILPEVSNISGFNKEFYYTTKIRQFLTDKGFSEVYTYSFDSIGDVKVKNPLASDKGRLRNSLIPGLSQSVDLNSKNADLLNLSDGVKIFEIGTVFRKDLSEEVMVGVGAQKLSQELIKSLQEEVFDGIEINGVEKDNVFEFSLTNVLDKLPEPKDDLELMIREEVSQFKSISPYPFVLRDISVWMSKGEGSQDLVNIIKKHAGELLATEPRLVDEYEKDGRISYAYRITFQSHEKTLSDAEVNQIMDRIYDEAGNKEGWEIR